MTLEPTMMGLTRREVAEVNAENQRLREALEEIAQELDWNTTDPCRACNHKTHIARKALEEGKK